MSPEEQAQRQQAQIQAINAQASIASAAGPTSLPGLSLHLSEIDEGELVRYRCHVGLAYAGELMRLALDGDLTRALASALRALEERVALAQKLHKQASENGRSQLAESWTRKAREFEHEANVVRDAVRRVN